MFPINDLHGNPIGFSGRTLKADEIGGKYINTPQTLIYNKSLVLFNLDKAKSEIKKEDLAIVVEGQMDALSVYQAGTKNVIASSGTALTLDQIKILKRYTKNIAIAFDADLAGESAAKRGIDLALAEELNVKVIVLPFGKDPDECIKKDPNLWFTAVKEAKSILEYYFDQTFKKVDLNKVEGKKAAAATLLPVIAKIGNKIEQTHWLQKLAGALNVSENILRESIIKSSDKRAKETVTVKKIDTTKDRNLMLYNRILAIVLKFPDNLSYLIDNLQPEIIKDSALNHLYKRLIIYYTGDIANNPQSFDYAVFHHQVSQDKLDLLADQLVLLAEKDFFNFDPDAIREELNKTINFAKKNYYTVELQAIERKIKAAETQGQKEELSNLSEQFNEIISQLKVLE